MRAIHLVRLDKIRPALVLTREVALPVLHRVTVAPIASTIRGPATEVEVGPANGLDHDSVVSLDNVITVASADVGALIGYLLDRQEDDLTAAIRAAFDVEWHPLCGVVLGPASKVKANDESNAAVVGGLNTIMETRPISATMRSRVVETVETANCAGVPPLGHDHSDHPRAPVMALRGGCPGLSRRCLTEASRPTRGCWP